MTEIDGKCVNVSQVQKENISPAMPMPSDEALERIEEMSAAYYATIGAF